MTQYTNQSAFDLVCNHIFAQGTRAMGKYSGVCAYRSEDTGNKCAIGALLTDEECGQMDKHDEGDINSLMIVMSEGLDDLDTTIYAKLKSIDTGLMVDLQTIHDVRENWEYTKSMRDELRTLAFNHGLNTTCLEGMHFGDR